MKSGRVPLLCTRGEGPAWCPRHGVPSNSSQGGQWPGVRADEPRSQSARCPTSVPALKAAHSAGPVQLSAGSQAGGEPEGQDAPCRNR